MRSNLQYIARKTAKKAPAPVFLKQDSTGRVSLVDNELRNNSRSPEKVYPVKSTAMYETSSNQATEMRIINQLERIEEIPVT